MTTVADDELASAPTVVEYDGATAEITRIAVSQVAPDNEAEHGRRIEFDPRVGVARFPFVWVPRRAMRVEVTFADPAAAAAVYVHVGEVEQAAVREGDLWVAELEGGGQGDIAVQYVPVAAPRTPRLGVPVEDDVRSAVPSAMSDFEGTEPVVEGNTIQGTVAVPGMVATEGGEVGAEASLTLEVIDEYEPTSEDRRCSPGWATPSTSSRRHRGAGRRGRADHDDRHHRGAIEAIPDWAASGSEARPGATPRRSGRPRGGAGPAVAGHTGPMAGRATRLARSGRQVTARLNTGLLGTGWTARSETDPEGGGGELEEINDTFDAGDKSDDVQRAVGPAGRLPGGHAREVAGAAGAMNDQAGFYAVTDAFKTGAGLYFGPVAGEVIGYIDEAASNYVDSEWDAQVTFASSQGTRRRLQMTGSTTPRTGSRRAATTSATSPGC